MNLPYIALRLVRRLLPAAVTRQMLEVGLVLQPGLETREPEQAAERYLSALATEGIALTGKSVMVFGYGGGFGVGVLLLRAGAASVTLCDRYARPSVRRNRRWEEAAPETFRRQGRAIQPDGTRLELLHGDIREIARSREPKYDVVLSSSVFEHLQDVAGVCGALARLTRPGGVHLHYIDVRDHYFRLPFEMLTYSEDAWRRFLNPGSNLNRLRPWHYRSIFEGWFQNVRLDVIQSEQDAFRRARPRIRPEHLSGVEELDSAGILRVVAREPRATPAPGQAPP